MSKTLTIEQVKQRTSIINPNIQILSNTYKNNSTKLDCKCRLCNYEWQMSYGKISIGRGCTKCAKKAKPTLDEIRNFNLKIEVFVKEYKNAKTKLDCKCKVCNYEWQVNWNHLKSGRGCPQCANKVKGSKNALSLNEAQQRLSHRLDIDVNWETYTKADWHIDLTCKICNNKWSAMYSSIANGALRG